MTLIFQPFCGGKRTKPGGGGRDQPLLQTVTKRDLDKPEGDSSIFLGILSYSSAQIFAENLKV